MCQCGVLAPTQSKYDGTNQSDPIKIRWNESEQLLQRSELHFFVPTAIVSRGRHDPWQTDHATAMDARKGATKNSRKFTSFSDRWQNDEHHCSDLLVSGSWKSSK